MTSYTSRRLVAPALAAGLLAALLPRGAVAGELTDLAAAALQYDLQLKVADAQKYIQLETPALAAASLKPTVSAAAAYQRTTITKAESNSPTVVSSAIGGGTAISGGNQSYGTLYYGASIQQALFDWEAIQTLRRSDVDADQARLGYQSALQGVFYRLIDAYFGVLAAQSALDADQNLVLSNERELKRQQKQQQAGFSAAPDVLTAEASLNSARNQVIADVGSKEAADSALSLITGVATPVQRQLKPDVPLRTPVPARAEDWKQMAFTGNPDLAAADLAVRSAELARKAAYGGYLPKLSAVGAYSSANSDSANGSDTASYYYGMSLSLPLYNGGATPAKVRVADATLKAAVARLALVKTQLAANVQLHYNAVITGIDGVQAARRAVEANEASVVAIEVSTKVGARSVTDSLIARNNLASAQQAYVNAKLRYLRGFVALKQDVGQLAVKDIADIDSLLIERSDMN